MSASLRSRAVLVRAGGPRSHHRGRSALTLLTALLVLAGLSPAERGAPGIVGRTSLPGPTWLFAWAAGAVLVVSFVALPRLWPSPKLEAAPERRLFSLPRAAEALCGLVGVAVFVVVVFAGVSGNQVSTANLAPTAVLVLFWIGVPILSALLGAVFRAFSPWRAIARALSSAIRRARPGRAIGPPLPYPLALGRWPAVAGLLGFAWLELVFVGRQHPATLAGLAVAYALLQLVGMAFRPGTVALIATMIGTTTFDGFLNGPVWREIGPPVQGTSAGSDLVRAPRSSCPGPLVWWPACCCLPGCTGLASGAWALSRRAAARMSWPGRPRIRWSRSPLLICSGTLSPCW